MSNTPSLRELEHHGAFLERHIGPNDAEIAHMLRVVGHDSLDAMTDAIVPGSIKSAQPLALPAPINEEEALAKIRAVADRNQVFRSFIGQGYYGTHTPKVILRNILENPAWYTAYTPYQAEISQGRMEALINFQTMVADLTGMEIANASLLDEATAAAEAMTLAKRSAKSKSNTFLVSGDTHPQTIEVLRTRAEPLGIAIELANSDDEWQAALAKGDFFGVLVQYPASSGWLHDWGKDAEAIHARGALVVFATDLLALTLLKPPGEMGADIVIGNTQRFGVPFGFGGPHAAFMACRDAYKRSMPGRLIGVSVDAEGKPAYRLTLQTREQHIRREKATSNICTAQVLLAVMASMYAVYHGPEGLMRALDRRKLQYTLDLSTVARGNDTIALPPEDMPFSGAFDVLEISPPVLEFFVDVLSSRKAVVTPTLREALPKGLRVGEMEASPHNVVLNGPESVISQMTSVNATVAMPSDITANSISTLARVITPPGVQAQPAEVGVKLDIKGTRKVLVLQVPILVQGNLPESSSLDPEIVQVQLDVPLAWTPNGPELRALTATVEVKEDMAESVNLQVHIHAPDGSKVIKVNPPRITLTIL